jgi:large subunit ribosomal protein L4
MAEARIYTMSGEEVGRMDLPEEMFGTNASTYLLWEVVRAESINARQGTVSTLTRSQVNASGKKPWRQKGTGQARSGRKSSPIWRGGGVAFGPKPRPWKVRLNKKVRRKALAGILSERLAEGNLRIIRDLASTGRTREVADMLTSHECVGRRTMILVDSSAEMVFRASRNIPRVSTAIANSVSVRDLVNAEVVLVSEVAVDLLKERLI